MDDLKIKLLSSKPAIFYLQGWVVNYVDKLNQFLNIIASVDAVILYSPSWTCGLGGGQIPRFINSVKKQKHRWIVMCNDYSEMRWMKHFNIEVFHCPQSAFLDVNLYKINVNASKKFDAVYAAQFLPFKRHELCKDIDSVSIVGYGGDEYYAYLRNNFKYHFANGPNNVMLQWEEVNALFNSARVGLCLSAEEGAMYASVEYMLCGLPVVTTLNVGGRDYFFDGRYVIHADSTPSEIAKACYALIDQNIDSSFVRQTTLKYISDVRLNFFKFISSLNYDFGYYCDVEDVRINFEANFSNKLIGYEPIEDVISKIAS